MIKPGSTDPRCQKVVRKTKAKECGVGKMKKMKTVIRKLEGLSKTLSINNKQLIDLESHSKDMDGKIEEILDHFLTTTFKPISLFSSLKFVVDITLWTLRCGHGDILFSQKRMRSEEHTSELQSRQYLVCRLLLEKKKKKPHYLTYIHYSPQQLPSPIPLHPH